MKKYLEKAKSLQKTFSYFQIVRFPRGQNSRVDIFSKLTSSSANSPIEEVKQRSIKEAEVSVIVEDEANWMSPIRAYLEKGELPDDKSEARRILGKSLRYVLEQGVLYRKSYLQPLLRCIGPSEAEYVLREVHEGACGSHVGSRALAKKIMRWGYY